MNIFLVPNETQKTLYSAASLWRVSALSLVVFVISISSGIVGWPIQVAVVTGLYSLLGAYAGRGTTINSIVRLLIAFTPWLIVVVTIVSGRLANVYPLVVAAPFALVIGTVAIRLPSRYLALRVVAVTSITLSVLGYASMINWLSYWSNSILYNDKVEYSVNQQKISTTFLNVNGDVIEPESWRGKTVVLDFWTTDCSACFRSFPNFQNLVESFRDDSSIEIYSVHLSPSEVALVQSRSEGLKLIKERNYTFPVLFTSEPFDVVADSFKFRGVPAVAIIDYNGIIKYVGYPTYSRIDLSNNIYNIIEDVRSSSEVEF